MSKGPQALKVFPTYIKNRPNSPWEKDMDSASHSYLRGGVICLTEVLG